MSSTKIGLIPQPAIHPCFHDPSILFAGGGRSLLQTAEPPVAAPSGTSVLYQFHGIGTQNWTSCTQPLLILSFKETPSVPFIAEMHRVGPTFNSKAIFMLFIHCFPVY